ncbi:MAG: hypothetical protein CMM15_05055 [Rhodospirillaceae bacterium]|nr:hypothetical protein [Rhodospirillaceae bacterium]|tara:strand:- start:1676 stop:2611 length:936 start_codon:yes stop_codon:yes gene_type:complete
MSPRKKTLVVILGETREHELAFDSFKKNVLNVLEADLCLCIGIPNRYDIRNPYYNGAKFRFTYPEPDDYATAFDFAAKHILHGRADMEVFQGQVMKRTPWRNFLKIEGQFMGGIRDESHEHPGSAGILLFYRWYLLKNLRENNLISQYDSFVITRSDFIYALPHPSLDHLNQKYIWIPHGESYGGITDRHAIVPSRFIESYLDILDQMMLQSNQYYSEMSAKPGWNLEQVIKFHLEQHGLLTSLRRFPYVMYSVRSKDGTTRWSRGQWHPSLGYFIKYPKEYSGAMWFQNAFKSSQLTLYDFYRNMIQTNG